MCGILLHASQADSTLVSVDLEVWESLKQSNACRGPDYSSTEVCSIETKQTKLELFSSVLGLRGSVVTQQPLCSPDRERFLAWNGQLFHWLPSDRADVARADALESRMNDGQALFDSILQKIDAATDGNRSPSGEEVGQALSNALAQVEGPYALVFVDLRSSSLFFARDPLGRRSLLISPSTPENPRILISSVCNAEARARDLTFEEADCGGIWAIDLTDLFKAPRLYPRRSELTEPLLLRELALHSKEAEDDGRNLDTQVEAPLVSPEDRDATSTAFLRVLEESVRKRVTGIRSIGAADEAHVAVLFSGGLDCATLALLADRSVPAEQPIDLLNVAFENPRVLDAAQRAAASQNRAQEKAAARRGRGRGGQAPLVEDEPSTIPSSSEPVDGSSRPLDSATSGIYAVPDRISGLSTYHELRRLAPRRRWNFVEVNVPHTEYCAAREEVEALMYPASSVMDLSIASALFFASRGIGQIRPPDNSAAHEASPIPYTTPARVLISGLGADELLAGYSRHRNAFSKAGREGLVNELQLDLDRLPTRNLGRDDRVLSRHGREARYPFLSRSVLQFLCDLPVELKTDMRLPEGVGDKLLLRDVARKIGLEGAASLKKRAIQFGARSAKMEKDEGRVKGHHALAKKAMQGEKLRYEAVTRIRRIETPVRLHAFPVAEVSKQRGCRS